MCTFRKEYLRSYFDVRVLNLIVVRAGAAGVTVLMPRLCSEGHLCVVKLHIVFVTGVCVVIQWVWRAGSVFGVDVLVVWYPLLIILG